MKSKRLICITAMALFNVLAPPSHLLAQSTQHAHHHYKLIVLGTLGGPQSFGDAGHDAGNIISRDIAAGTADTAIHDPLYPLFNPGFASLIGLDPYIYHGFIAKGSTLCALGGLPGGTYSTVSPLSGT